MGRSTATKVAYKYKTWKGKDCAPDGEAGHELDVRILKPERFC